jgi:hypothetical protein
VLALRDLGAIYQQLNRPRSREELADAYHAAVERGRRDLPGEPPGERALSLLATAVPRLISLAVATYALHSPTRPPAGEIDAQLLATVARTACGALCRGDLALQADGRAGAYAASESLIVVFHQAAQALGEARLEGEPPSIVEHSQQAGRWAAIAIEALDAHRPAASEAIIDCQAHLLCVCVFADTATAT